MAIPDRLYIDKNDRKIIKDIEDQGYYNFKNCTNKEIFMFAMSIGANVDIDDYDIKVKEGYFLAKDLHPEDKALMFACAYKKYKTIDIFTDIEKVYNYCQKCAHLGFKLLSDEIKNSSFGSYEKQAIIELNDAYDKLNLNN